MVKADTNYDKRVFVVIGGGEVLRNFIVMDLSLVAIILRHYLVNILV